MNHNDFINAHPILIVYPAGLGGEHIAHTLSTCCDQFEDIYTWVNKNVNQYHSICALRYMDLVEDITKFENGIETRYKGDFVSIKKRIIVKDHPSNNSIEFYKRYLPDITIIYIDLAFPKKDSIDYFADLAIKKLAVKVDCPITVDFINSTISTTLSEKQQQFMIDETKKFDWVWRHELYALLNDLLESNNYKNPVSYDTHHSSIVKNKNIRLKHTSDINVLKEDHKESLINTYITFLPKYVRTFKNLHVVDSDNLDKDSTIFWQKIKKIVPKLDTDKAIGITNRWIENNNKLGQPNE
ncbi:hypothetical protein N9E09_01425 [bacterium]|jgi:hypothetical protein|nr:hypothetical protein [bacterium]